MKNRFFLCWLGLALASCRGVELEQFLSDLPPGSTAETGAFSGNFTIPVPEVRAGAPLYIQGGNTLLSPRSLEPSQPYCLLSSIELRFEDEALARELGIRRVRMSHYVGALTTWVDQVHVVHEYGAFRAGGATAIRLREYRPSLNRATMDFSFEGDLDCYRRSGRSPTTGSMSIEAFFRVVGFQWIWRPDGPS